VVVELEEVSEDEKQFNGDRASDEVLWLGEELKSADAQGSRRTFWRVATLFSM
jgi:hypothetical protein